MEHRRVRPLHNLIALAAVALFLTVFAYASDPPTRLVARYTATLMEPGAPGKHPKPTFQAPVRLSSGAMVMATLPSNLIGAPIGTPLIVSEYRTLIFRRISFTGDLAKHRAGP